jgi:hypothetical protein
MTGKKNDKLRSKWPEPQLEDPMMLAKGFFFPTHGDVVNQHRRLAEAVRPLAKGLCRAYASGPGGVLGPSNAVRMEDQGIDTSLNEWLSRLDSIRQSIHPHSISISDTNVFSVDCTRPVENMRTSHPASGCVRLFPGSGINISTQALVDIARASVLAMDADGNCAHAFVDYGYAGGYGNLGSTYGAFPISPMTWQMWVDWIDWGTMSHRHQAERVRRVAWGNYFGHSIADRLGPTFLDEFLALSDAHEGSPQTGERLPGGGLYLTLCQRPQDQLECENVPDVFDLPVIRIAAWITQQLRRVDSIF